MHLPTATTFPADHADMTGSLTVAFVCNNKQSNGSLTELLIYIYLYTVDYSFDHRLRHRRDRISPIGIATLLLPFFFHVCEPFAAIERARLVGP